MLLILSSSYRGKRMGCVKVMVKFADNNHSCVVLSWRIKSVVYSEGH